MTRIADSRDRSCRWVRERLAALASGDLPAGEQSACRAHLEHCDGCSRELAQAEVALEALRGVEEVVPPPDAMERLLWHLETLPIPAKSLAWRGWLSWSAAAATVVAGVMVVLVLQRGAAGMRAAGEVAVGPAVVSSAEGRAPSIEKGAAPAPVAPGSELSGGRPSTRPGAVSQAAGPSPAREAAPLTSQARKPASPARHPGVVSPARAAPPASAGPSTVQPASAPERASTELSGPSEAPVVDTAEEAFAPALAERGMAGAPGALGAGGGTGAAEGPSLKAAGPGTRPRTLAARTAPGAPAGPSVTTVSEPFWHLRVEAPARLTVGMPAEFGLTIEGRESLVAVRAGVQDSEGRPLGREVELALVEKGRRVQASLSATMQKPGPQQVAVALEAEQPPVKTRVTLVVDVQPPPCPEPPMVSLVLREVPLREAAAALARRGRIAVEVDDALADLTVDCNLADPIPVETALGLLAEQVGGRLEKMPDGTYHIGAGD